MALDFATPRYAQLVTAIQERITSGAYAPGSLIPTEAHMTSEFGVSRATVVRALQLLKADGWIESQQGRGTYVRSEPVTADPVRRGAELLTVGEPGDRSELLHTGPAVPPPDVASALGLAPRTEAVLRRRVHTSCGEPLELVSAWFPADIVEGTELGSRHLLAEGTADHLRRRKGIRMARVTERITARMPTAEETKTLGIPRRVPVLDLLVIAYEGNGAAVEAVTVTLPADRHELEDGYAI